MKSRYSSFIYLALFSSLVLNIVSCNINNDKNKINEKPTAYAGEDRNVKLNENIKFTGYGTDSDGFIDLYQWDLDGDGSFDKEFDYATSFTYLYNKAGIYKVTLRVTDDKGATAEDNCIIKAGYPYPKEGEENWAFNDNPISSVTSIVNSTVFKFDNKYYMLISSNPGPPHNLNYAKSDDGKIWQEIDQSEFPCGIPTEANNSDDIEIKYEDGWFTITFSSGTPDRYLYFEKSKGGIIWTGGILSPPIIGNSPSYVETINYEYIWYINLNNEICMCEKPIDNSSWTDDGKISDIEYAYNSHVIFDGKTYFMWYTDTYNKAKLLYSTDHRFLNCIQETILNSDSLPDINSIYSSSIIFNYDLYSYILYILAHSLSSPPSNYKLYTSCCTNFVLE